MRLLIIEASGKIPLLKNILSKYNEFNDMEIIATKGQIYDLPSNEIGINIETLEENKIIRNEKLFNFIKSKIKKSSEVFLMCDNDVIGEQICRDIIDTFNIEDKYNRVRISNLSEIEVINKIKKSKGQKIDMKWCEESDARRVLNRLIGYSNKETDIDKASPLGRITSPLIKLVEEIPDRKIKISLNGKNNNIKLISRMYVRQGANIDNIDKILKKYLINNNVDEKKEKINLDINYLNCSDALILISNNMNKNIHSSEKILQESYEKGMISYFRTPSRNLSKEEKIESMKIWNKYNALKKQIVNEVDYLDIKSNDPHSCVHPVSDKIPLYIKEDNYLDDYINASSIISNRHFIKDTCKDKDSYKYYYNLNIKDDDYNELLDSGLVLKDNIIEFKAISCKNGIKENFFDEEKEKFITKISFNNSNKEKYSVEKMNLDIMLTKYMSEYNIGKPSTYGYHSRNVSLYFDKNWKINGLGKNGLRLANNISKKLLDKSSVYETETILEDRNLNFVDKIKECLNIYGINIDNIGINYNKHNVIQNKIENNETYKKGDFNI